MESESGSGAARRLELGEQVPGGGSSCGDCRGHGCDTSGCAAVAEPTDCGLELLQCRFQRANLWLVVLLARGGERLEIRLDLVDGGFQRGRAALKQAGVGQ